MNSLKFWSRTLKWIGGLTMLAGTLDPMEGSVLILAGSGLVALGLYLARTDHRILLYWTSTFILIALGVAALFGLSSIGGIGGRSGHSMWWGVMILPYPLGWLMALLGGAVGLLRLFKAKASKSHS